MTGTDVATSWLGNVPLFREGREQLAFQALTSVPQVNTLAHNDPMTASSSSGV